MHTFVVSKPIGHAGCTCANCPAELEDLIHNKPALWCNVNVMMKATNANTLDLLKTVLAGGLGGKSAAVGAAHAPRERCSHAQLVIHQLSHRRAGAHTVIACPVHLTHSMVGILSTQVTHILMCLILQVTHNSCDFMLYSCHLSKSSNYFKDQNAEAYSYGANGENSSLSDDCEAEPSYTPRYTLP